MTVDPIQDKTTVSTRSEVTPTPSTPQKDNTETDVQGHTTTASTFRTTTKSKVTADPTLKFQTDTTETDVQEHTTSSSKRNPLDITAISLILAGGIILVLIIVVLMLFLKRRQKEPREPPREIINVEIREHEYDEVADDGKKALFFVNSFGMEGIEL